MEQSNRASSAFNAGGPTLPEMGFVRLKTVLAVIPISKSLLWDKVGKGEWPQPIRMGRVTMWSAQSIRDLVDQIERGA